LNTQQEKLLSMQRTVTARIETFRTQKEMVKAQYNAAQAQVKINETLTGMSEEMGDMTLAMQRAQDKVLSMQARADAMETLIEEDHFSVQALPPGSDSELDRELRKISAEQNIEDELQALKQQMQLGGPHTSQKQIEGQPPKSLALLLFALLLGLVERLGPRVTLCINVRSWSYILAIFDLHFASFAD